MNKTGQILIACAAGAALGAFSAIEINGYFWWLGLLIGALAGYVVYVAPKIPAAFMAAYRAVREMLTPEFRKKFTVWCAYILWAIVTVGGNLLVFVCLISLAMDHLDGKPVAYTLLNIHFWIAMGVIGLLYSAILCIAFAIEIRISKKYLIGQFAKFNPLFIYTWWLGVVLFYFLPKALIWVAKHIPRAIVLCGKAAVFTGQTIGIFCKTFFITVHSQLALLCAVDSALGAAVGFFAGSVLIGAIAGAVFGVINYQVVTIRWLKLKPVNNH